MSRPKVKMYCADPCPYCVAAETLLKQRGVPYDKEMVDYEDAAKWDELERMSGMQTVPQIWHGDQLIGGLPQLQAKDREDKLASLK